MVRDDLPVVVVGGGPVGLTAACLLADLGVPVVLIERDPAPQELPRAVHLDDEALRVLDGIGALAALRTPPLPAEGYEFRGADGRLLCAIRPRQRSPGRPASAYVHQPAVEAALRDAVGRRPLVSARLGWEVLDVTAEPASVRVRRPDGGEEVLDAAAVLACDGAGSTIRRTLGGAVRDLGFDQAWAVVDVRLGARPARLERLQQRCDPARPATSVPTGGSRHRFERRLRPGERTADVLAPPAIADLLRSWGVDPAAAEVERAAAYTFHAVLADRWRIGGVFLLGDAAHQMPPFLGQGLGAGLRDAANLAWKLALVRAGAAAEPLLATYEAERRAQVRGMIRLTVLLGRFITEGGPAAALLRSGIAAAVRVLPPARSAAAGFRPPALPRGPLVQRGWRGWRRDPAGHPFPEPCEGTAGTAPSPPADGDALLGGGFALVALDRDPLAGADPATRRLWEALGARRVVVAADPYGHLRAWFRDAGAEVAVVRPDRVVLAATGRGGLPDLTGRLAPLLGRSAARP